MAKTTRRPRAEHHTTPVRLDFVSRGNRELDETAAMGDPAHMVQVGVCRCVSV